MMINLFKYFNAYICSNQQSDVYFAPYIPVQNVPCIGGTPPLLKTKYAIVQLTEDDYIKTFTLKGNMDRK